MCQNIRRDVLGERHPHYLISLNNTAVTLLKVGRLIEALKLQQRCLNIRKDVLGETNIHCLISLDNMGRVLFKLGRFSEALKFHEKCKNFISLQNEIN